MTETMVRWLVVLTFDAVVALVYGAVVGWTHVPGFAVGALGAFAALEAARWRMNR